MDGFRIDLEALYVASLGLHRIFGEMAAQPVRDIDCPAEAIGHSGLAQVTEDFCHRWQRGVKHLLSDGETINSGLRDCLKDYSHTDQEAARVFDQLYGK